MKTLLIDDEPDILNIIEFLLKKPGREFIKATTVREAIPLMSTVDLILSDVGMPDAELLEEALSGCNKPLGRIAGHSINKSQLTLPKPFLKEELEQFYLKVEAGYK
jgi:hypothetical protein